MPNPIDAPFFKDARLDQIARDCNVAQFVSFGPDLRQRYARIRQFEPNHHFADIRTALDALLVHAGDRTVNIRSFTPDSPHGVEFVYGIPSSERAIEEIERLAARGLFLVVNETVDVNDGGVSGVVHNNVMEFAPGATPKIVETDRIVSIERAAGEALLRKVYGFEPALPHDRDFRVEFSVHPVRRGFKSERTIIWEVHEIPTVPPQSPPKWPNDFSKFLGDKTFGLLIADGFGLEVPRTTVLSRNVLPFTFGRATGTDAKWLRTAPAIPEPGLFPTVRGWADPFKLIQSTSPDLVSSILIQDEVVALFSGAMVSGSDGRPIVEGVAGFGSQFMLGRVAPAELDRNLYQKLDELHSAIVRHLGSVRVEWVFDGDTIWIIQLQQETASSNGKIIVPGAVQSEVEFESSNGLSALRSMIDEVAGTNTGIKVIGEVGMTSHIADLLRRHNVPSRIATKSG